jgi:outer membrane protein assembly factor BamD (BamD/ComL family)
MAGFFRAALFLLAVGAFATPFDDGKDAFAREQWKPAVAAFERFLKDNSDSPQAPTAAFLRAVALYQMGDYRASLDAFQKFDRTWPQSPLTRRLPYWKGTAALAAGQPAVAARELAAQAQFPQEEPYTTRSLLNLALAYVALGQAEKAAVSLESFIKASHEDALVAQAWTVWGDLDRAASRNDSALDRYRKASAAQPGGRWDLAARTQAVDLLAAQNRWTDAKAAVDAAASVFPGEADRWDERRVTIAKALGDRSGLVKALEARWNRAEPPLKQELAVNRALVAEEAGAPEPVWWQRAAQGPDDELAARAIERYAFSLENAKQWGDAARALESWAASRPAPRFEQAGSRAAQDRLLAGDGVTASKLWTKLLVGFPQSPRVPTWLLARGRAALDAGDTTRALEDFTRITKDFASAAESPEARYQTGLVYLKRQEPVRAESWFYGLVQDQKAGDLYQRALLARGVSFVDSGQGDLARGSLQRLIREAPDSPWATEAWIALGRNALQGRVFDEATDALAHAIDTATGEARGRALWYHADARAGAGDADGASADYARYAAEFSDSPRTPEALYRQGAAYFTAQAWQKALDGWNANLLRVRGAWRQQIQEGIATALLRLGRASEGWDKLTALDAESASPDAMYRWGQAATVQGEGDWAMKAFQTLLQKYPESSAAVAALPRAAGALLGSGRTDEALARYADYFQKYGSQPSAAPVARSAATAALAFPATLEALIKASAGWKLAPEVSAEFALVWAQSRLDSDTDAAQKELAALAATAPWTSQRSEALATVGRWHLAHARLPEAREALEAAAGLGDDLSVFKARWGLAQVTAKEGDLTSSARQREAAELAAGPGVPIEFRLQVLQEAADTWTQAGKPDDAARVKKRMAALTP